MQVLKFVINKQIFIKIHCYFEYNNYFCTCVFHSIRFKVNKEWVTAVTLFLCFFEFSIKFPSQQSTIESANTDGEQTLHSFAWACVLGQCIRL